MPDTHFDIEYRKILADLLTLGKGRDDRTGTGVRGLFGRTIVLNPATAFPLLTLKRVYLQGVVDELAWFLSGSTNVNDLPKKVRHWWTPFAGENGELGPTYGEQFKLLQGVIEGIRKDPNGRRHVLSLWDGHTVNQCRLPPCHGTVIQFYVEDKDTLCMSTYQRSCDVFLGLPVNVASYALLQQLVANELDLKVGTLTYMLGDYHLYNNHVEQATRCIVREGTTVPWLRTNATPKTLGEATLYRGEESVHMPPQTTYPTYWIQAIYAPHIPIRAEMSV